MPNSARAVRLIQADIRETKREMKAMGVKRVSCFNGGLDRLTYQFNSKLFDLSIQLEKAKLATMKHILGSSHERRYTYWTEDNLAVHQTDELTHATSWFCAMDSWERTFVKSDWILFT